MLCRYERTIFKSDKGFCIFAYSTSDESVPKEARNRSYYHDDKIHFTAIGYHLIATDAVEVELDGTWENSKHGLQLSVSMCKEVVPRDQAGILAYLSSGIIKGIGPETAKAIVARFGDKTMEVLEKEPDKLLSVKGIAQKKLKAIIKSYGETKALSDLMIYLAPFGVSMKKVAMIREEFGDNSLRIVKTDPFQLCKIKGFGFMTVDSVARKTKVSLKHPLRYSGAINYVLDEARVLTLCPTHQSALKERGLKPEEMERLCYRTTPTTRLKRIVTELLERGCILDGVPGFYCQKDSGQWVLDIRGSGIMLPDRNLLGQIEAIQVRLDKVYNQKFYNLTSVDQYYGTQSKCCPHYVGVHEGDEVVCLTEGVMKSDLAYSFAQGSPYECGFVGLTGIPSYSQYERALEELDSIGVKRINVMVDSDYQVKEEVRKARDRYIEMGAAAGFEMAPITWTQKQKGVDDLYKHLFRDK